MYYFYDATYILVIIGAIISLIASMNVKSTFNRYDKYNSRSGLTGAMAAQEILRAAGITNVRIERVSGNLTDHYSPKEGVLRLSDSVYNSTSVAAIGVPGKSFRKQRSVVLSSPAVTSASWVCLILTLAATRAARSSPQPGKSVIRPQVKLSPGFRSTRC